MANARTKFAPSSVRVAAAMRARADPVQPTAQREAKATLESDWRLRRWEAAETHRLNEAQWQKAFGQQINQDLLQDLKTLRARSCYEAANNPMVAGVINTHACDIWGEDGPTLQVESEDMTYNEELERIVRDWFTYCDYNEQLQLADMGAQWVNLWWTKGEHLLFETFDSQATSLIRYRVLNMDPDRLETDPGQSDPAVALGIRRSRTGKPLTYFLRDEEPIGAVSMFSGKYTEYSRDEIIHQFRSVEPGQLRGFPWLASQLQVIADLRDFDQRILDIARLAASQGVVWYTEHPDAEFVEVNASVDMERNTERTGPAGYKPEIIDPKQPATTYVEYRNERHRELGRPVSMPLLTIRLGAEEHNFSSARFDGQNYQRALAVFQAWTARMSLNRMVNSIAREASLIRMNGRFLLPDRPKRVRYIWTWPRPPHVDPKKEADAARVLLEWGIQDLGRIASAFGTDVETLIANHKRINKMLTDAGLPPIPFFGSGRQQQPTNQSMGAQAA